ncbi:MAG: hypothetical protein U1F10_02910 [Burkholderiales bacterium]
MTAAPLPATGRLAPRRRFFSRLWWSFLAGVGMIGVTLAAGMVGYHLVDNFSWLDAFHQSSMLLAGMGPVREINTEAGKLFDSFYALFCAFVMLGAAGIVFTPLIHRLLHRFHIEDAANRQ